MPEKVSISSTSLVCSSVNIVGEVTIGPGCVIQPKASIIAEGGPINIGSNNIISEQVTICNKKVSGKVMNIGNGNVFESRSSIECMGIGHNNVIQTAASVIGSFELGNNCVIGVRNRVNHDIEDGTVVFGDNDSKRARKDDIQTHVSTLNTHLEYLRDLL
ncbi:hypothetical protein BB559_006996 [Furculomyces boomerangus]|uniref:Dynactin subunit 6 n=2 Tax=Harpellales TaxID=61421 RepID=A0A2T9XZE3_9FUNG|nr:hypothetical protein BB559_006996 [Furculomyces boomerangus]PWA01232.1 hypothetical protein BB558_002673 [Smittium angustum]